MGALLASFAIVNRQQQIIRLVTIVVPDDPPSVSSTSFLFLAKRNS
ncbi:hypothetical protein CI1B_31900 [Bradyrhizobium ivorense]|uniref:Uncharacterized protein n=1 Tax=Bradyrhizobium ivorense TaxID=2511166 RepID=A0A508T8V4_9BRAD|nr:hypothetical protein CI1B_31900 [Bradyrhizobium ivorense]